MVGKLSVGDQIREKDIRFRNNTDYQAYNNAIVEEYDAEDAIFIGYIYKISTLQFNIVIRSNIVTDVILNMKISNIEVIFVSLQQKVIVLSNVLIT